MPISLIVFDCDGVILESVDVKTKAFGRTMEKYGPEAVSRFIDYHVANGGVSRYKKFEWFYREVLGRTIDEAELASLAECFKNLVFEGVMNAPMVRGALASIETLHHRMPMYVASGTPTEELTQVLNARNLTRFFKGVYGSPPAKTELLKHIIEQEGTDPADTLMIGDSSTDLAAAQACGTLFWGRGESFKQSGWPWSEDLRHLLRYIDDAN